MAALAVTERAEAQPPGALARPAQGFSADRFYPSAPGGGWFVMDSLDMRGGLGGAMEVQGGYARNPLRIPEGPSSLDVVQDQAFADIALAVTYDRWRLYLNLEAPLVTKGDSGTASGDAFTAPSVSFAATPDIMGDVRVGFDGRLFGGPSSPLPSRGGRAALRAGGRPHQRLRHGRNLPRDAPRPRGGRRRLLHVRRPAWRAHSAEGRHSGAGRSRGERAIVRCGCGTRVHVGKSTDLVVGPEIYGETAFRSFFGSNGTGVEGLVSSRVEGTADDGLQLRLKLGTGGGLDPHFGAPEWRVVVGIEMFNHNRGYDKH